MTALIGDEPVATFDGQVSSRELVHPKPHLKARVYDFNHLFWTHTGAMFIFQGSLVFDILGGSVLVRGKNRPMWDPRPGMNNVRVVVPLEDPKGLLPIDIFNIAIELGF